MSLIKVLGTSTSNILERTAKTLDRALMVIEVETTKVLSESLKDDQFDIVETLNNIALFDSVPVPKKGK